MNLIKLFVLANLLFACLFACKTEDSNIPDQDFNTGWLFQKGDVKGAELFDFDDSDWRKLDLPHDWAAEGPFSRENNARTGGLPVHGTGWYRKHFVVDESMKGKKVSVEFDGAMNNAFVWLNGQLIGNRPYGYIGFEMDLTPFVKFGEENVITVRLSPEDLAARWYTGAGIYRNVRIKYNNPLHVAHWGTFVKTPKVEKDEALVDIKTSLENSSADAANATLNTSILNANGEIVATASSDITVDAKGSNEAEQQIVVKNPKLWDVDSPILYTAVTEVVQNGKTVDRYETEFGIRTIEFTPNDGFLLNGKRLQLNGVCMHHDLGLLGAAFNYRARERQMQIMKSMGVNALRTSHNPPSPDWLKICDRLGIVVQVEAFDEWQIGKVPNGYHKYFDEWHERDLRDMIRSHRNHPSVIMWSIGNEILEQGREDGWKLAKVLNDICHDEDTTRPTTAGFNYYPAPFTNKLAFQIDVVGLNYWPLQYKEVKEKYPDMIVYGSETESMTSSRGVYHLPIEPLPQKETGHVSSYDVIVGPPWSYAPDIEFDALAAEPASLGEFMWTGFDYLGEPTPYGGRDNSTNGYWNSDWPSHSSYFGPVDLCGFPKDRYYLYQSQWTSEPMVHLLPHWNWEGKEGENIPVFVYTNCDEAELFVNGKSLGKKVKGKDLTAIPSEFHFFEMGKYESKYRLSWEVPYEPGSLKVVAYKDGHAVADEEIKTAGEPAKVVLSADRQTIAADGKDLSYVTIKIVDADGNFCPLTNNELLITVEGEGGLAGAGNGDQTDLTVFQSPYQKIFNGMCLAIIKGTGNVGDVSVSVSAEGLETGKLQVTCE